MERGSCSDKDSCFDSIYIRTALFWVIARVVVIPYRRFEKRIGPIFKGNNPEERNSIYFTAEVWNHARSAEWSVLPTVVMSLMGIYPRCEGKQHSLQYTTVTEQTVPPTTSSSAVSPTPATKSPAPRQTRPPPKPCTGIISWSVVCIYTRFFF